MGCEVLTKSGTAERSERQTHTWCGILYVPQHQWPCPVHCVLCGQSFNAQTRRGFTVADCQNLRPRAA